MAGYKRSRMGGPAGRNVRRRGPPRRRMRRYARAPAVRRTVMSLRETKRLTTNIVPGTPIGSEGDTLIPTGLTGANCDVMPWAMAKGLGTSDREGDECYATGLYAKFLIQSSIQGTNNSTVRVIAYTPRYDKDDVMPTPKPTEPLNADKFQIHHDKQFIVAWGANQHNPTHEKFVTCNLKFRKVKKLYYSPSTSTYAPSTPMVKFLFVSQFPDPGTGSDFRPQITNGTIVSYFKDA